MDRYPEAVRLLTVSLSLLEAGVIPMDAVGLTKTVIDELAELKAIYPDSFVGG